MTDDLKVDDGQVVSMHYTLHVDGKVVDSSEGGEPLQFIQGMGHIIPGLENELYDMKIGDSKKVVVAAKDGYGESDAEAFMEVPRDSFPPNVPLQLGTELELRDQSDHPVYARIESISDENVRLNMNHPLAGKELHFDVKIADLRAATDDEVSHGHVHSHEHDH
ncbi:MAG TPA: peptidylprolyl isomerase [Anaerolineales bacterium]|jgi:FKBP-type peptidyl-prolyl cis-trans isomerase SlyD|nr:peptidylprolyl isomerase [Anaerolineales bacterium]